MAPAFMEYSILIGKLAFFSEGVFAFLLCDCLHVSVRFGGMTGIYYNQGSVIGIESPNFQEETT